MDSNKFFALRYTENRTSTEFVEVEELGSRFSINTKENSWSYKLDDKQVTGSLGQARRFPLEYDCDIIGVYDVEKSRHTQFMFLVARDAVEAAED